MLYSLFLVLLSVGIYTAYGCDPRLVPEEDCSTLLNITYCVYRLLVIYISFLAVSENPRTTVVKTNDTVHISCGINKDNIDLLINESFNSLATSFLEKHQITINCSSTTHTCSVLIPAIIDNDDLQVQCVFADCCTEIAVIHVVDGEQLLTSHTESVLVFLLLFHRYS